jgi:hypothetical protein
MRQTWALFVDAYRELNAKKLFWISLILSALVVGIFALVGVKPRGLSFASYYVNLPDAWTFYKGMYSELIIGLWLTWGAMILALISTSTMVPDLITSGTVDLYISRPLGRWRLFLTKYVSGLLFAAVQVAVVAAGSVIVIRWRGGHWMPSLLLAIPLVVLTFSYVFAVIVLIGTWTRSAVAATLLGLLCWGFFSGTQFAEEWLLRSQMTTTALANHAQKQIRDANADIDRYKQSPLSDVMGIKTAYANQRITEANAELPNYQRAAHIVTVLHNVAAAVWLVVPKTRETSDLLDRYLLTDDEAVDRPKPGMWDDQQASEDQREMFDVATEAKAEAVEEHRHRSIPLIVGTSLAFEVVMVSLAAWIFCRRDY